jgi:uncharacterized protein (TIGR02246 family)
MKNTLLGIVVFLAGLGIGYCARIAGPGTAHKTDTRAADLAAIEKLHKADMEATLKQDADAMTSLWSDDAAKLDVPGSPVVGAKAMKAMYEKFQVDYPEFQVLKYAPNIKEVQIADGWAIEVGDFEATYKLTAKDAPVSVSDKGARVLKRQNDGSWKLAVVGLK